MVEPFGRTIDRGINGKLPTRARAGHDGFPFQPAPVDFLLLALRYDPRASDLADATVVHTSAIDIP